MESYPTYDALAVDLDLHFFDKVSILRQVGNQLNDRSWFVVTDDGYCHLFDKYGNLDDIGKLHTLKEDYIRRNIKKIIIPDSMMSIWPYAFQGCHNLTTTTIPNSVTSIGKWTFSYCVSLTNVMIPNSMMSIELHAFYDCNSLTSMIIPESIRYIGYNAFCNCKNLKNLFFKGKTLKQVKAMEYYPWGIEDESIIKVSILS